MRKLGLVGLGISGAPMAARLIAAGHEVFLYTRSKGPAELRTGKGKACDSMADVAQQADIVFLMVPDTPDVAKVLFGEGGVASALTRGKTVVDMSSISPMDTKEFAQKINARGCDYLDATVAGGEEGAKAASLTILVVGPDEAFAGGTPRVERRGKTPTR